MLPDTVCVMDVQGDEDIPGQVDEDHEIDIIRIGIEIAEDHGEEKEIQVFEDIERAQSKLEM
jgi:hypothetical protein